MINYFSDKDTKHFSNNSKKYWDFYSSFVKTRKDSADQAMSIKFDEDVSDPEVLYGKLNQYFVNLPVVGKENKFTCAEFVFDDFKNLKRSNKLKRSQMKIFH
jgi:hypothetical protein